MRDPLTILAFNQEKALVGAFLVIVKTDRETDAMDRFTALVVMVVTWPHCSDLMIVDC